MFPITQMDQPAQSSLLVDCCPSVLAKCQAAGLASPSLCWTLSARWAWWPVWIRPSVCSLWTQQRAIRWCEAPKSRDVRWSWSATVCTLTTDLWDGWCDARDEFELENVTWRLFKNLLYVSNRNFVICVNCIIKFTVYIFHFVRNKLTRMKVERNR